MAVLSLLMTTSAFGQIVFGQSASGKPQFIYSHWTLTYNATGDEATISQSYIPLSGFVPLRDNLEARVYLASSSNSLTILDADNSLSGFSDVRIQLSQSLSDDRVLLSGGLNLPTGKTKLNFAQEWGVVELLSQDFLEFPQRRLGEGFGFNVMLGGATAMGDIRLGGGVMYRFTGEYQPYDGTGDYNPGDVITINGGADIPKGNMTWSANVVYTMYGDDKQDGTKTFKQSQQLAVGLNGTYANAPYTIGGWLSYVLRGDNTFYTTDEDVLSELKLYGNEFAAGAALTYKTDSDWYFIPSAKIRMISENDVNIGSASVICFGGAIGKTISESLDASAGFKYFTGSALDDMIDLTGYQLSLALLAEF